MRELFVNTTELVGHLMLILLNSIGRPCLVDKLFEIIVYFFVKIFYILFEKFLIPALSNWVVLIEMKEIKANLKHQIHKLLHVINV